MNTVFPLIRELLLTQSLGKDISVLLPIFCNLLAYFKLVVYTNLY